MKSPQLLRLQQQFLKSLHSGPTPWLLDQIVPARGFAKPDEVLNLYLHRAMARTVDPLHDVFRSLHWLLGDEVFDGLLERFYAFSPGEPLNAQLLASEFAGYLSRLDGAALAALKVDPALLPEGLTLPQALVAGAMFDWRCMWTSQANSRRSETVDALLHRLHHRCSCWSRPRLDRGTRLCDSGVDLAGWRELVETKEPRQPLPMVQSSCDGSVATFLIHSTQDHEVRVRRLAADEARLLNHCDGTHTVTSLIHEASFRGQSAEATMGLLRRLVEEDVIVELQEQFKVVTSPTEL
ncbi:DNA-binding domain-containing protein [Synechococcus sp. CS-197]|uniref:HvfC/BufC N-terminal domain-containing protein n=1 Tax=Synechococcus sp. CS-197 TaxID=2847985 RepID=UPI00015259CB|nr:DNA-binding domain-containing protein [Synechococcus sp. CS-197]MCT0250787.1 DNA-binding domain-containing protein [Synechococcus sp. CS-197]CAK22492.1 Conserved hypothetical protein [Synechococcus sp. WH 7803]